MNYLNDYLGKLQSVLSYNFEDTTIHFQQNGIGRSGTTGFILGLLLGVNFCILVICSCVLLSGVDVVSYFSVETIQILWV